MAIREQSVGGIPGSRVLLNGLQVSLLSGNFTVCPAHRMEELRTAGIELRHATQSIADTIGGAKIPRELFNSIDIFHTAAGALFTSGSPAGSAFHVAISATGEDDTEPLNDVQKIIEKGPSSVFTMPLWVKGNAPGKRSENWTVFSDEHKADSVWGFWVRWYDGMLRGEPMDWELQRRVALIDREIWEVGPEAVAARIRDIETEFFAERLPQAEKLARGVEDGLYFVSATVTDPDAMLDRIFNQVAFSLEIALKGHNTSGFSDMCVGYQYIEHTLENCRDDPNAIHMHFRLAREVIEGKLRSDEYRAEDGLSALVQALERHELQMRADHPEVRKAHDSFVAQRIRELDDEKRLALARSFRGLEDHTKSRLRSEFRLDAETLETNSSAEAQADAAKRSGGRSQRMSLMEKAAWATTKADESTANKATGLAFRLKDLAELLGWLF